MDQSLSYFGFSGYQNNSDLSFSDFSRSRQQSRFSYEKWKMMAKCNFELGGNMARVKISVLFYCHNKCSCLSQNYCKLITFMGTYFKTWTCKSAFWNFPKRTDEFCIYKGGWSWTTYLISTTKLSLNGGEIAGLQLYKNIAGTQIQHESFLHGPNSFLYSTESKYFQNMWVTNHETYCKMWIWENQVLVLFFCLISFFPDNCINAISDVLSFHLRWTPLGKLAKLMWLARNSQM